MALNERDREDLLADGTAMPIRGEAILEMKVVLVGFRPGGQVSLYVGPDPVFQFNADNQLRRVYWNENRYSAIDGRLCLLERDRRGGQVTFRNDPVAQKTQDAIRNDIESRLSWLGRAISDASTQWRVVGTDEMDFRRRIEDWLGKMSGSLRIASTPGA